jgi:hypothetical protein
MVGLGEVGRGDAWLPAQARRDLDSLNPVAGARNDLVVMLPELTDAHPVQVGLAFGLQLLTAP